MVAKTYQGLPFVGEVYTVGKNSYINVLTKKGVEKRVRWYTVDEYCKMYPDADRKQIMRENDPYWKPLKHILMGTTGFVWVLEGDPTPYLEELRASKYIWYNCYFGWHIKGDQPEEIVTAASEWFVIHPLTWEEVSLDEDTLRSFEEVSAVVNKKCNGKAAYKWQ